MIKSAIITIVIVSTGYYGHSAIEDMIDNYRAETTYYHCVRSSAAITDMETVQADRDCRESTGFKGE